MGTAPRHAIGTRHQSGDAAWRAAHGIPHSQAGVDRAHHRRAAARMVEDGVLHAACGDRPTARHGAVRADRARETRGRHRVSEPTVSLVDSFAPEYRVERELGRGATAKVYLAEDIK